MRNKGWGNKYFLEKLATCVCSKKKKNKEREKWKDEERKSFD